jgi:uncharacterized membrane protein
VTETPGGSLMNLARLEAFSDGVFAFAATLLVIELRVPDLHAASNAQASHALVALARPLLAYVTSFLVIGVIWLNHHPVFKGLTDVDRPTVLLNLALLIVVAFLPFPTELISEYGNLPVIVAFYGFAQAATGATFCALWFYVERRYRLATGAVQSERAIAFSRLWAAAYPVVALGGSLVAFESIPVSVAIYALLPVAYLLPNAVEWQLTRNP